MDELGILYHYLPTELEPPSEVWNQLVKVLDDAKPNSFKKMDGLEITPPNLAWENIALALNEHDVPVPEKNLSLADVFSSTEITPPTFVWGKIETSLDAQHPIRSIGNKPQTIKKIAIVLAIAACITSIIFSIVQKFDNQPIKQNNTQVAIRNKIDYPKQGNVPAKINSDSQKQTAVANQNVANQNNTEGFNSPKTSNLDDTLTDERVFKLEKYKLTTVANINTTNGTVASNTSKIKDALGNVIDRIGDYNTSSGYLAAVGPNGNSVNVSMKLANMIKFFQEDSAAIKNEEYLDKVMRESNVWRQKLIDWQKKVDGADANPSQMNFLDPIDLIRFLEKNK